MVQLKPNYIVHVYRGAAVTEVAAGISRESEFSSLGRFNNRILPVLKVQAIAVALAVFSFKNQIKLSPEMLLPHKSDRLTTKV